MQLTDEEKWGAVESHYRETGLKFNFKPKPKDINFLYDELQKFKQSTAKIVEKDSMLDRLLSKKK